LIENSISIAYPHNHLAFLKEEVDAAARILEGASLALIPSRGDLALGKISPARYTKPEKAISLGIDIMEQDSVIIVICWMLKWRPTMIPLYEVELNPETAHTPRRGPIKPSNRTFDGVPSNGWSNDPDKGNKDNSTGGN